MVEITQEIILAYAIENAIKYKGQASQGAVLAGLFAEGLEKSEIPNIMPKILETLKKVNSMSPEDQLKEFEKLKEKTSKRKIREGLKELPNAENKKITMRLAPFPSGPLHIGNARNIILNDEYIKTYKGKLLLIFDDTIGSANKQIEPEAYNLIQEGLDWLDIKYDKKIIYKSDRTKKYYEYAEELLKKGYLYVCHCNQEIMQDLKAKGIACSCREFSPEEQLKRWKEMFTAPMGSMSVRIKTNIQDPDPAFRDRVMFKISDLSHPITKNKFRVYPSMDFTWGIDDHVFGSTHILRGIDHQMSTRIQNFIREIFGWENPEPIYNGHLAIEGIKISKSLGTQKIKSGEYTGWNDPRTWSLQSLRDRGIKPEAVRQFILNLGIKRTSITTPIETLYSLNKELITDSPRYFFVEDPQQITIKGCPYLEAKIPLHPNNKLGYKTKKTTQNFLISKKDFDLMGDQEYRLMHLLTFNSNKTGVNPRDFSFISEEPVSTPTNEKNKFMNPQTQNPKPKNWFSSLISEEPPIKKTKFLHWLPACPENVKVEIVMPDGNIKSGLGENELESLKVGEIIQFERFGFVRLHKREKGKLEFWFAHN